MIVKREENKEIFQNIPIGTVFEDPLRNILLKVNETDAFDIKENELHYVNPLCQIKVLDATITIGELE